MLINYPYDSLSASKHIKLGKLGSYYFDYFTLITVQRCHPQKILMKTEKIKINVICRDKKKALKCYFSQINDYCCSYICRTL